MYATSPVFTGILKVGTVTALYISSNKHTITQSTQQPRGYIMKYSKVRFTSEQNGSTASIILTDKEQENMTVSELSRKFPIGESLKMERLERGPYFDSFNEAFGHDINGDKLEVYSRI